MLTATKVEMNALTRAEHRMIVQALDVSYNPAGLGDVLFLVQNNKATAFRISGDASGIAVVQVLRRRKFQELFVWILAGKRLLYHIAELDGLLTQVAKTNGCTVVHCNATPKLAKIYQDRMKFKQDSVSLWKEV